MTAVVLMVACHGRPVKESRSDELQVRDSIDARNFQGAHRLITQHMENAKDSDEYYSWMVSRNNAWYAAMQDDSFQVTTERIHQYLLRHKEEPNETRQRLWAEWLMARGVYFSALVGNLDSAIVCTQQALERMSGMEKDWGMRIVGMTNLADYYRQSGRLDQSAKVYMQALHMADSLDATDEERIAILIGVSTAYTFMNDHVNSHEWWERTAKMLPVMRQADQFIYYNNRGNDYCFQQKYDSALHYFSKASDIVRDNPNKKWDYHTSNINLGEVFLGLGNADSARYHIQQADSFFHQVNFKPFLYYIETEKIHLALLEGRMADALRLVKAPSDYGPQVPDMEVPRLKMVERVLRQTGYWRGAYEAAQRCQRLSDSIQSANVQMKLSTRLMQYEHDKRLLEQQSIIDHQQQASRLTWVLLAAMLLAVITLIALFLLRRRRQRLHDLIVRQQIVSMRMENTRNRITPHFIYNALSHEMLGQTEGRQVDFTALTTLLRKGLDQADMLQTTLADELAFVDYYVEIEGRQMGETFRYEKDIADDVDPHKVNLPTMTLQIFTENAIKHGLRRQGGTLTIRVSRQQQATLVEVMDNGKGVGAQYQEHTGLRVVRQTIQMLNEHNRNAITFGIGNQPDGGCRSWLMLPDDYNYQIDN